MGSVARPYPTNNSTTATEPVVTESGTAITLALSQAGSHIRCTNSSDVVVTVPPQSSVAWEDDTQIAIEQAGDGTVTIAPGSGVTISNELGLLTRAKNSRVYLKRVASDSWILDGEVKRWSEQGVLLVARNENTVTDGRILLSQTDEDGTLTFADDGVIDPVLINPSVHVGAATVGGTIYFSGPGNFNGTDNATERNNLIIRKGTIGQAFTDIDWSGWQSIERGNSAYSKLVPMANGQIGIVYELWESSGLQFKSFDVPGSVTRPDVRQYNFTDTGNELVDNGSDGQNAVNTSVAFGADGADFSASGAYLDVGNGGDMAYFGRDLWNGIEFEFTSIKVPNTGNRQCICGTANTGTTELFYVFVDTNNAVSAFEQGSITVALRHSSSLTQAFTATGCYAADTAVDIRVEFRGADNTCHIYVDDVEQSVTKKLTSIAHVDDAIFGTYDNNLWLGCWNNRGTVAFEFEGTLQQYAYRAASALLTQDESVTIVNSGADTERIPSLKQASNGDLLVAYEHRIGSSSDNADNELRVMRSTDNGATWASVTVSSVTQVHQDPCLSVDDNGRVHLVYLTRTATIPEIYAGNGTADVAYRYSDDHGATWSAATDITSQLRIPSTWTRKGLGSDGAAFLAGKRICVYGWYVTNSGSSASDARLWMFYSDDYGTTWVRDTNTIGPSGNSEVVPVIVS